MDNYSVCVCVCMCVYVCACIQCVCVRVHVDNTCNIKTAPSQTNNHVRTLPQFYFPKVHVTK